MTESEAFMISAFTSEARAFLRSFKKFCSQTQNKVASVKLLECLGDIANEFDKYIELPTILEHNFDEQIVAFEKQFPKYYSCKLCGVTNLGQFPTDVQLHVKSQKHLARLNSKVKVETQENKENVPKAENSRTRREERNRSRHVERENKFRQKKEDKEKLQMEKRVKHFFAKPLDKMCKDAMAEGRALIHYEKHETVRQEILKLIKPFCAEAKVHFFGSRINGLGSKDSDIDIFLELDTPISQCFELSTTGTNIDLLKSLMSKENKIWKSLTGIKDAKVPILKDRYHPESIECDISFSNPFGVYNTQLIYYLLEMQPLCYKMCIIMKKAYGFSQMKRDRKTFSSYSMILMVIFYLQTEKMLPSIKALQCEQESDIGKIGPWNVTFLRKTLKELDLTRAPDDIANVRKHLIQMLKFYMEFDYKKNIISTFLGTVVSTSSFVSNMEHSMPSYFQCLKLNKCEALKFTEISLQDPLILNFNVTKNVNQNTLNEILDLFALISGELTSSEKPQAATAPVTNGISK